MLMVVASTNSSNKFEERRGVTTAVHCSLGHYAVNISPLGLLSFGPAIVGSHLLSILIECMQTNIYIYNLFSCRHIYIW